LFFHFRVSFAFFLVVHLFLPKILRGVTKKMAAMLLFLTKDCPDFTDNSEAVVSAASLRRKPPTTSNPGRTTLNEGMNQLLTMLKSEKAVSSNKGSNAEWKPSSGSCLVRTSQKDLACDPL
jgi:hypothetical protein